MSDGYLLVCCFSFFFFAIGGSCKPANCLTSTVLCLCLLLTLKQCKSTHILFKNHEKVMSCSFSGLTVNEYMSVCSSVICILRYQWSIWAFICPFQPLLSRLISISDWSINGISSLNDWCQPDIISVSGTKSNVDSTFGIQVDIFVQSLISSLLS